MKGSQERFAIQTIRILAYGVLVLLIVLNHVLQPGFYNWELMKGFYSVAALGLLVHGLPLFFIDKYFSARKVLAGTFVFDVILISYLLWSTGLNQSLFLFLYLLTIIIAALVFRLRGALLVAGLSSIGFTLASLLGPEVKAMAFLFIVILNNIAFFGVALLGGYLSEQLNLFAEKLQVSNLNLNIIRKLNELIVETIPFGLLSVNEVGDILNFNPGAQSILRPTKDLIGLNLFLVLPDLKSHLRDLFEVSQSVEFELPLRQQDENRLLRLQILPQDIQLLGEQTFLVILEDLTQMRKLEMELRQNEKLAAIGQLAAGIAHEIRNPLAGISGSIELLSQNFTTEEDKKLTKIILREIDRLNNLISEFLDYSKPEKPPTEVMDLVPLIKEVVESAQFGSTSRLGSALQVDLDLDLPEQALIRGEATKLKQALLNIVINAYQAMSTKVGARLGVRLRPVEDNWVLNVSDNGAGMSEATQKRLFEPFHTTKPKGTGLGLAITHKILQSHGAGVTVDSNEGQGTIFILSFPIHKTVENFGAHREQR